MLVGVPLELSERCRSPFAVRRSPFAVRRWESVVTVVESRPLSVEEATIPGPAGLCWPVIQSVLETIELRWVDVCKPIVKRRFALDGTEISFSSQAPLIGAGCDVEVAKATVRAVQGWIFAFAAFGPVGSHRACQPAVSSYSDSLCGATERCSILAGAFVGAVVGRPTIIRG
jgi:hypothetical protein